MIKKNQQLTLAIAAGLSIAMVSGCAGKRPNEALQSAQSTYERVSEKTLQGEFSTEDLNVAKTQLDNAESVWNRKKDKETVDHRAYVAEQFALIAEQRSDLLRYQASIKNANQDRTRIQVELRAAEADTLQDKVSDREEKLAQKLKELEELKALQAKNTDRGMVLTLGDVLFDSGESTLKQGARYNVEKVAKFLQDYPDRFVTIEGHTDNIGDAEFNYNLSLDRAFAVRAALASQGVDVSRIKAKGFGEDVPLASNTVASGRQMNRRVELIFNEKPASDYSETVISEIDD